MQPKCTQPSKVQSERLSFAAMLRSTAHCQILALGDQGAKVPIIPRTLGADAARHLSISLYISEKIVAILGTEKSAPAMILGPWSMICDRQIVRQPRKREP